MKIQKKMGGVSGGGEWGVRVDVYIELKFLRKLKKKWGRAGGCGRCRFGGVWVVSQGGCERRIEVFVKIQYKKNLAGLGVG